MKIRRIVSLTAALSFITMLVSSIVLFIVPEGRVAHWANWKMLSLTKEQWADFHTILGFLFLITLCFHIYFNWKAITTYLKTRSKEIKVFTPEFNIAVILVAVTGIGTLNGVPPFSSILHLSESIKKEASFTYGEPPFGGAQRSSLTSFANRMNIDLKEGLKRLESAGLIVDDTESSLQDIAEQNNTTPQQIYLAFRPDSIENNTSDKPQAPSSGFGKLTLQDLVTQYGADEKAINQVLAQNTEFNKQAKLKDIGAKTDESPRDIFEKLTGLKTGQ